MHLFLSSMLHGHRDWLSKASEKFTFCVVLCGKPVVSLSVQNALLSASLVVQASGNCMIKGVSWLFLKGRFKKFGSILSAFARGWTNCFRCFHDQLTHDSSPRYKLVADENGSGYLGFCPLFLLRRTPAAHCVPGPTVREAFVRERLTSHRPGSTWAPGESSFLFYSKVWQDWSWPLIHCKHWNLRRTASDRLQRIEGKVSLSVNFTFESNEVSSSARTGLGMLRA